MAIHRQLLLPDFSYVKDPITRQALEDIKRTLEDLNRSIYKDLGSPTEGGGTPTTVEIADAAAAGSGPTFAFFDHIHAVGDPSAPGSLTNPQTATEGTSVIPMRSDAKAGIPAPATPTTQAFGDSASSGAGTGFATDTHKHGMPTEQAIPDPVVSVNLVSPSNFATNSATYVDITGATVTFTPGGANNVVIVLAQGIATTDNTVQSDVKVGIDIDGAIAATEETFIENGTTNATPQGWSLMAVRQLSAASHTIKLRAAALDSQNVTFSGLRLAIIELKKT